MNGGKSFAGNIFTLYKIDIGSELFTPIPIPPKPLPPKHASTSDYSNR